MAKQKGNSPAIKEVASISRNPIVKFVRGKEDEKEVLLRGDYLYLEIDIQRPDDELQEEFFRIIKKYKSALPPGRKKASDIKGSKCDIGDIYDAKHKDPARNTQEIIIDKQGIDYDVDKNQRSCQIHHDNLSE